MQQHTAHAGWKYTISALAVSFALAPVAQAASLLSSPGKFERQSPVSQMTRFEVKSPTTRTAVDTTPVNSAELVATKTKELAGQEFTFEKWRDATGAVTTVILDAKGNEVSEQAVPQITQIE